MERRSHPVLIVYVGHIISDFGVHEGDNTMYADGKCNNREHLGGKRVHE